MATLTVWPTKSRNASGRRSVGYERERPRVRCTLTVPVHASGVCVWSSIAMSETSFNSVLRHALTRLIELHADVVQMRKEVI